ncbi:disulfide bond formation protein B [Acetobacter fallax]|uniref:Disulfide bond formation protein B n=1 Tax=Acetobacter fallax TaxID=1737473 RepID=A0ABX0KBN0_9PROT|nr:disulfide bond formation protein B [Acetobacter fallax]NHO31905.1 disulfide bond formation protein B [Acetobacter fallax]NHO35579.1 disulfide bond formation protein B [Acetobacter fallax]
MSLLPRRRIFRQTVPGTVRLPGLLLVAASAVAFAMVWWVQDVRGIMPCELCLWERWPWRVALVIGFAGLVVPRRMARGIAWLGVLPLVADIGLSVLHAGVEWKLWPSPLPSCRAPLLHGTTPAERLASMPLTPGKPCDAPTYLVDWLPVSMTVLEGVAALAILALLVSLLLIRRPGGRKSG